MSKREDEPAGLAGSTQQVGGLLELLPRPRDVAASFRHVRHAEQPPRSGGFGRALADRESTLVPARCFVDLAAVPPEAPDRSRQHECALPVAPIARERQRLPYVFLLERKTLEPLSLIRSRQQWLGFLDEREIEHEMTIA